MKRRKQFGSKLSSDVQGQDYMHEKNLSNVRLLDDGDDDVFKSDFSSGSSDYFPVLSVTSLDSSFDDSNKIDDELLSATKVPYFV